MREVLLGHVGVDSGQLIVTDPVYINNQWKKDGAIIGVKLWGQAHEEVHAHLKDKYPDLDIYHDRHVVTIKTTDSALAEEIYDEGHFHARSVQKVIVGSFETDSTYDKICDVTLNQENQGGPIPYKLGHEGFAVAFSSGLGDGLYPVYATIEDIPGLGERITKVEIRLIEPDDLEDDEDENND